MNIHLKERPLPKITLPRFLIGITILVVILTYQMNMQKFIWLSAILFICAGILFFLKNIDYLFWLFIVSLPFSKAAEIRIRDLSIQPSQVLILLFALLWFFHCVAKKEKSVKLPHTPIDLALAVFMAINILSIYQSYNIPLNYTDFAFPTLRNQPFLKSISQIVSLIPGILSYYMTVTFLRSRELIVKAIKVWFFTLTAIAIFGVYQFVGYYLKLPLADYYIQSFDFRYIGSLAIPRVSSVSLEPIFLAMYIMSFLPLVYVLFFSKINLIKHRYLLISILASSLSLIFTFSTTNIFMVLSIAVFGVYVLRNFRPRLSRAISVISFIVILAVIIPLHGLLLQKIRFILNTNSYEFHISSFQRMVCWKAAFNMFLRHPFLGVGIGNFALNFLANIPGPHIVELMTHTGMPRITNNIYLETLAETGISGFLAFMYLLYSLLKGPLARIKYMRDKYWDTLILGLLFCFVGILAGHLFTSAFYFPYIWVLMGLISATERVTHNA